MTRQAPHAAKFRIAFVALAVIAAAAVVIAIIAGIGGRQLGVSTNWSSFVPSAGGEAGAAQIADHVAASYRLNPTGQQLDVATPIALTDTNSSGVTTGKGLTLAINSTSAESSTQGSLSPLDGEAVGYDICGIGTTDCKLAGSPSEARLLLVQREALELALYTLEYESSVQFVLVVLTPAHTVTKSGAGEHSITIAVLFSRTELQTLLNEPLDHSLAAEPPDAAQLALWVRSEEAALVDDVTARGLFEETIEQDQQGSHLLILTPIDTK